eukprot:gene3732-7415_t
MKYFYFYLFSELSPAKLNCVFDDVSKCHIGLGRSLKSETFRHDVEGDGYRSINLPMLSFPIIKRSVVLESQHNLYSGVNKNGLLVLATLCLSFGIAGPAQASIDLKQEITEYEKIIIEGEKEPKLIMQTVNRYLQPMKRIKVKITDKDIEGARDRVLTLKAYLDEIERDVFRKNWDRFQSYLYVFSEQEDAFALLIQGLFPSNDPLDEAARQALSFEAKGIFLALDDLREAGREQQIRPAQRAYAQLLLSYDRFLKAGDLYPAYDPITSTEIFFRNFPKETLRYNPSRKLEVMDEVLLITGPDMGKTGKIIDIIGKNGIIKLDPNGLPFQEVKIVRLESLAKTIDDVPNTTENLTQDTL